MRDQPTIPVFAESPWNNYVDLNPEDQALLTLLWNTKLDPKQQQELAAQIIKRDLLKVYFTENNTPLHIACTTGLEITALKMIEGGAPLEAKTTDNNTPLHLACNGGHEDLAIKLLQQGAVIASHGIYGFTPLHFASHENLNRLATELIARGAPLNSRNDHNDTPLHVALKEDAEQVALSLIKSGASLEAINKNSQRPHQVLSLSTNDMIDEFINHCILPVFTLESDTTTEPDVKLINKLKNIIVSRLFPEPETPGSLANLEEDASFYQIFFRSMRLSNTWHHDTIQFPEGLTPLKKPLRWYPILAKDAILENGLHVTCLTSTENLKEESRQLAHCVGKADYDQQCCKADGAERPHILSIRDKEGNSLSTLEVMLVHVSDAGLEDITIGKSGFALHVVQHCGKNDAPAPPEAITAWKTCCEMIKSGSIMLETNADKLGETEESKVSSPHSALIQRIGYIPSWKRINQCFDEFRMPYRRATLDQPQTKRVYDDVATGDGYSHESHFIQGYAIVNADHTPTGIWSLSANHLYPGQKQTIIDLRTLDIKSWLSATGALQEIQQLAGKVPSEDHSPLITRPIPEPEHTIYAKTANRDHDVVARGGGKERPPFFA